MHKVKDRVLWSEGSLLTQQHLQQWDSYQAWLMQCYQRCLHTQGYGFKNLKWDPLALEQGIVSLLTLEGIFPSGEYIYYHRDLHGPLERNLSQHEGALTLYLTRPNGEYVSGVTGYDALSRPASYDVVYEERVDLYDPKRIAEVAFCKPRWQLSEECEESSLKLPVFQGVVDNSVLSLDEYWLPPLLCVKSQTHLVSALDRLLEVLESAILHLTNLPFQDQTQASPFASDDRAALIQGLLLSRGLVIGYKEVGRPQDVHEALFSLYCLLQSQLNQISNKTYLYDHNQSGNCLFPLIRENIQLAKQFMHKEYEELTLMRKDRANFYCQDIGQNLAIEGLMVLAINQGKHFELSQEALKKLLKIGPLEPSNMAVVAALTGLELQPIIGRGLAEFDHQWQLFEIKKEGAQWQRVLSTHGLNIHVPKATEDWRVRLLIVKSRRLAA